MINIYTDEYEREKGFVTYLDRKPKNKRVDNTTNYVSFFSQINNILNSEIMDGNIRKLEYDDKTNMLKITDDDGTETVVSLNDRFVDKASYDSEKKQINIGLNDNSPSISLDMTSLEEKFYTTQETEDKISESIKDKLTWGNF